MVAETQGGSYLVGETSLLQPLMRSEAGKLLLFIHWNLFQSITIAGFHALRKLMDEFLEEILRLLKTLLAIIFL